jgi:hypothetical protein
VAALQSLDELRSAVAEDMVLASTLHVPGHHLLACRAEAFGTPFSAPPLQTLESADSLGEDAKQVRTAQPCVVQAGCEAAAGWLGRPHLNRALSRCEAAAHRARGRL